MGDRESGYSEREATMKAVACLAAILIASLVSSCRTCPSGETGMAAVTEEHSAVRSRGAGRGQAVRRWALGCAAVLTERNHDDHRRLAGCDLTERSKAEKRLILADSWGIRGRADLLATLTSLEEEGHRADFAVMGALIALLDQDTYERLLAVEREPEAASKMEIARTHYTQLGDKSLYGWDYSRAICLCRWGYVAEYLSEEEAWNRIMPLARVLQDKFDSWEDLGRNYLIGRRFWSHRETVANGWLYEDAVQRLLDMRDSPWNQYAWNQDLSEDGNLTPKRPRRLADAIVACR